MKLLPPPTNSLDELRTKLLTLYASKLGCRLEELKLWVRLK